MIDPGHAPRRKIDKSDFIWLAYLIFFIFEPVERKSTLYWVECLTIIVVFVAMYIAFLRTCNQQKQFWLVATMWLLGVNTLPFNGGGTTFIIYSAALAPYVTANVPAVLSAVGAEAILLALECHLLHFSRFSILLNVFFLTVVGGSNVFFAQKHRADAKLRLKQEEIEALAALAERERIARDLHDVLGHTLSLITLKAELAGRLLDRELTPTVSSRPDSTAIENLSSRPNYLPTNNLSSRPEGVARSGETPVFAPAHSREFLETTPTLSSPPDYTPTATLSSRPDYLLTDLSSRPEGASGSPADLSAGVKARSGETPVFAPAHATGTLDLIARARTEIADVERTARTALAEVRDAIGGYRARGLAAEIDNARHALATAGVTLTTEGDLQPATLTAAEETVLALALREAVTNIVRHAQATTCRLRLVVADGRHRLSIQDNGHHPAPREGNGLRGMRERVESLGGHLSLTREEGTHLQIELPLRTRPAT